MEKEFAKNLLYKPTYAHLNQDRPTVDAFFEGVMVMAEEADVRANRLDLLQALLNKMGRLADFSALQM